MILFELILALLDYSMAGVVILALLILTNTFSLGSFIWLFITAFIIGKVIAFGLFIFRVLVGVPSRHVRQSPN